VSAARYNAQYSFKTTRLKTFGSHLVYIKITEAMRMERNKLK